MKKEYNISLIFIIYLMLLRKFYVGGIILWRVVFFELF